MNNNYADALEQEIGEHKRNLLKCVTAFEEHAANMRRAQEALQNSEQTVRALFENASHGIVVANDSGVIVQVNAMAGALFGYSREELIGASIEMLLPERFRERHLMHRASYFNTPHSRPMGIGLALSARRKNGGEFPVEISLSFVKTDTERLAVSFITDITERKKAEEALLAKAEELAKSNADLQQFAYATSHDLQEPLRMMSTYAEMLELRHSSQLDENARRCVNYIVEGAQRMEALIQGMLAFSRVANAESLPVARLSLESIVAWARQNLEAAIEESKAVIEAGPTGTVTGNQVQLVQLFQNLIGNAIRHQKIGVPPVIRIESKQENGNTVIRVSDNGPGIDRRYFDHIFGVFKRLNRNTPGAGIGLALCKRIVEKHHGRIWVESEPGHGAAFVVALPDQAGEERKWDVQ